MTILIPARNAERWIARAMVSVANQSHVGWDVQVLVDCSTTDNTYQTAINARKRLKRGRSIHINISREQGLPRVYRELIDRAEPYDDVCGFLDADDRLTPDAVADILSVYHANNALGHVWSQFAFYPGGAPGYSKRLPSGMDQIQAFSRNWWGSQHFRTFRKSVYKKSPLSLQLDVPLACDFNLACVIGATNCPALFVNKVLYIYYVNPDGVSNTKRAEQRQCYRVLSSRFMAWANRRSQCASSSARRTG